MFKSNISFIRSIRWFTKYLLCLVSITMVFLLAKHQGVVLFSTLLLFLLMDITSALSPDGRTPYVIYKYSAFVFLVSVALYWIFFFFFFNVSPGETLLSFKTGIVSSDGVLLQWRQEDPDPCGWKGVTCDNQTKRVIHLWVL